MSTASGKPKLFISTGCSSSDLVAAPLLAELRRRNAVGSILGVGGEPLRDVGAEILYDSTALSTIGTSHLLSTLVKSSWGILRLLREMDRRFKEDPPSLAILVDNSGINFRMLSIFRRHNIPILYYVPPELWSIWPFELSGLRKSQAKIAAIFESQQDEYRERGLDAAWIGHPILDLIQEVPEAPATVGEAPVIGLFPGSRLQEFQLLLDPMLDAATLIKKVEPRARFILCAANSLAEEYLHKRFQGQPLPVEVRYRESHAVLSESHLALVCSGTITLEATLLGVPMVAMYRLAGFDNVIRRLVLPMLKYPHFSLPNVLLQRQAVTELSNREVTGERICQEALPLLRDPQRREKMRQDLASVQPLLGSPGAVGRAADLAEQMMADSARAKEQELCAA